MYETEREWLSEKAAKANTWVCVLADQGIGEMARAIALCGAVKASLGPQGTVTLVGHYDGTMAKRDMAHRAKECLSIDNYIEAPTPGGIHLPRAVLIDCLVDHFDVLYDAMPIAVKTYERSHVEAQAWADNRLAPYATIYHGWPIDNWRLKYEMLPWWEIMSLTTGFDIGGKHLADDLFPACALECAPWPEADDIPPGGSLEDLKRLSGADEADLPDLPDGVPYVVVHSGAGYGSRNKIAPKHVTDAIIKEIEDHDVPCVQVGVTGDQLFKCRHRIMDVRLPITNQVIQGATCLVDNEGMLNYMAQGLGVHAAVMFSVTPYTIYGMPGNLNLVPGLSRFDAKDKVPKQLIGKPRACPLATCFWGGGWTWGENWCSRCRLEDVGFYNPENPSCMNFPKPADAAREVWQFVDRLVNGAANHG